MDQSVRGKSVPEAVMDRIRRDVADGVWKEFLPGSRTLADHYGVSNGSVCTALKKLEDRGEVAAGRRGHKRRILAGMRRDGVGTKQLLLFILSETVQMDSVDEAMVSQMLDDVWRPAGHDVVWVRAGGSGEAKARHQVSRWIKEFAPDRIAVFMGPGNWIQALHETGLPMFCLGGELMGLADKVSGYAMDLETVVELSLVKLRELGHSRILLPQPADRTSYPEISRRVYRRVLGDVLSEQEMEGLCPVLPLPDVMDWQRWWLKHLAKSKATAVMSMRESEILSLIGVCMASGIKLPKQLDVVATLDSKMLDWFSPVIHRVRHDESKVIKHFRLWADGGKPEFHYLKPIWEKCRGE
ncbi:hypothetical protein NT6N_16110 [Oceaniferula spumae]|uniref:HTH gntR-type domain-containing protein n=1 Tax=Oceaniferula spumae TaxID=2979115 RepID=A0AAT9FKV9_9BACT